MIYKLLCMLDDVEIGLVFNRRHTQQQQQQEAAEDNNDANDTDANDEAD